MEQPFFLYPSFVLILLQCKLTKCCWYQDVHERFRTESHSEAAGRFNERFLLSLASCITCVVMDDELNVLPISSHIRSITPVPVKEVIFCSSTFGIYNTETIPLQCQFCISSNL